MNIKRELQNLIDHYGKDEVIESFADWINEQAAHCTDRGDNDAREVWDAAYDALLMCLEA